MQVGTEVVLDVKGNTKIKDTINALYKKASDDFHAAWADAHDARAEVYQMCPIGDKVRPADKKARMEADVAYDAAIAVARAVKLAVTAAVDEILKTCNDLGIGC